MNITFIKPNMYNKRSSDALEPLVFAILKGVTPKRHTVSFFDERLEELPDDDTPDLVAITVETYTARRSYELADHYRFRGIPVVLGGFHPTMLPDEASVHADAVVCGDAETIWPRLIDEFESSGRLQKIYSNSAKDSFRYGLVDRSIFMGKQYSPMALVQYGRGCRYNCDFCSIRAFYGSSLTWRPVEDVIDEIRNIPKKHFFFTDDNLFSEPARARRLFELLVPLKKKWVCQISIDVASDRDILKLMKRAGCMVVIMGFESLEKENLVRMNKKANLCDFDYKRAIGNIRSAGIMIYGTFVFGYENDRADSFDRVLEFSISNRLLLANFNPLTPMPGTSLYDRLQQQGRLIFDRWWLDDLFCYGDTIFEPIGMKASQLAEGCNRIRNEFASYSSIFYRALDLRANLGSPRNLFVYLLANFISRREIHAKQGSRLGSQQRITERDAT